MQSRPPQEIAKQQQQRPLCPGQSCYRSICTAWLPSIPFDGAQGVQSARCAYLHSWLQEQPTQLTTAAEQPAKTSKIKKRQAEAGAGAPATNGIEQPADAVAAKRAKLKRKKQKGLAVEPAAETADTAEPSKQKKKQKPSKQVPEPSTLPLEGAVAALTAPGTAPAKEKKGTKRRRAAGAQPASVPEAAVPAAAVADAIDKKAKKRRKKAEGDAAPALDAEAPDDVPELKLKRKKLKVCSRFCTLETVSGVC